MFTHNSEKQIKEMIPNLAASSRQNPEQVMAKSMTKGSTQNNRQGKKSKLTKNSSTTEKMKNTRPRSNSKDFHQISFQSVDDIERMIPNLKTPCTQSNPKYAPVAPTRFTKTARSKHESAKKNYQEMRKFVRKSSVGTLDGTLDGTVETEQMTDEETEDLENSLNQLSYQRSLEGEILERRDSYTSIDDFNDSWAGRSNSLSSFYESDGEYSKRSRGRSWSPRPRSPSGRSKSPKKWREESASRSRSPGARRALMEATLSDFHPRADYWVYFSVSSCLSMVSLFENNSSITNTEINPTYLILAQGITLASLVLALFVSVAYRFSKSRNVLIRPLFSYNYGDRSIIEQKKCQKCSKGGCQNCKPSCQSSYPTMETMLTMLQFLFTAASSLFILDPSNGMALVGLAVINSNLFWSTWISFALVGYLFADIVAELVLGCPTSCFGCSGCCAGPNDTKNITSSVEASRGSQDTKRQFRLWTLQLISSFPMIYSHRKLANGVFCQGSILSRSSLCLRATEGQVHGLIVFGGCVAYFGMFHYFFNIRKESAHVPAFLSSALSIFLLTANAINVANSTSAGGPGATYYNVFLCSWVALGLSFTNLVVNLDCWILRQYGNRLQSYSVNKATFAHGKSAINGYAARHFKYGYYNDEESGTLETYDDETYDEEAPMDAIMTDRQIECQSCLTNPPLKSANRIRGMDLDDINTKVDSAIDAAAALHCSVNRKDSSANSVAKHPQTNHSQPNKMSTDPRPAIVPQPNKSAKKKDPCFVKSLSSEIPTTAKKKDPPFIKSNSAGSCLNSKKKDPSFVKYHSAGRSNGNKIDQSFAKSRSAESRVNVEKKNPAVVKTHSAGSNANGAKQDPSAAASQTKHSGSNENFAPPKKRNFLAETAKMSNMNGRASGANLKASQTPQKEAVEAQCTDQRSSNTTRGGEDWQQRRRSSLTTFSEDLGSTVSDRLGLGTRESFAAGMRRAFTKMPSTLEDIREASMGNVEDGDVDRVRRLYREVLEENFRGMNVACQSARHEGLSGVYVPKPARDPSSKNIDDESKSSIKITGSLGLHGVNEDFITKPARDPSSNNIDDESKSSIKMTGSLVEQLKGSDHRSSMTSKSSKLSRRSRSSSNKKREGSSRKNNPHIVADSNAKSQSNPNTTGGSINNGPSIPSTYDGSDCSALTESCATESPPSSHSPATSEDPPSTHSPDTWSTQSPIVAAVLDRDEISEITIPMSTRSGQTRKTQSTERSQGTKSKKAHMKDAAYKSKNTSTAHPRSSKGESFVKGLQSFNFTDGLSSLFSASKATVYEDDQSASSLSISKQVGNVRHTMKNDPYVGKEEWNSQHGMEDDDDLFTC